MPRACFVSDLHLFTRRTRGQHHWEAIRRAAATADHFVLGGDIFDFKWSTISSTRETVEASLRWLHELAAGAPRCRVHFILGNHDHHDELTARLPELAETLPNFAWDCYYVRLGDTIFLHGDVADRKTTAVSLEQRRLCIRHVRRAEVHHRAYEIAVRLHLHAALARALHPRRLIVRRIASYLRDIGHGPESGVRHVCFGHTHRAIDGFEHGGLKFYNGGAPIGRSPFRILELEVSREREAPETRQSP